MSSAEPRFLTLHELVQKARQKLNHDNWDYIIGGTETETTLRRNRASIDALAFRPRVLRDVSTVSARTNFLGRDLRLPILLAPVGSLELFAQGAGAAAATPGSRRMPPWGGGPERCCPAAAPHIWGEPQCPDQPCARHSRAPRMTGR